METVARTIHPGEVWQLVKESVLALIDDNATRLAAALAYYALFSIAPLLVIAVAVAGAIFGHAAARGEIVHEVQRFIGADGARLLETGIANAAHRVSGTGVWASILNGVVLVIAASAAFVELQTDLNTVWGVEPKPAEGVIWSFVRKRLLSFAMILATGLLLLVLLVLSAALAGFGRTLSNVLPVGPLFWQGADFVVALVVVTILFAMIFRFVPDVYIAWGDVWFGALLTAFLFSVGKLLIGLYLAHATFTSTYGAAGALVVLIAWVYYSALIFFLGAEFTQVWSRRRGSGIRPGRHAVARQTRAP